MASKKAPFPFVSPDLVAHLTERFPTSLPHELIDHREMDKRVGQAAVVRFLEREMQKQQDNLLE